MPVVTDTLPSKYIYRGSTASQGFVTYTPVSHTVVAALGLLRNSEVATVTITGTVSCSTFDDELGNIAVVSGAYAESNVSNNQSVEGTVISGTICADLGDAPDSYNQTGIPMSAYPGVLATFPTVFNRFGGYPAGPKHIDAKSDAWLGEKVSGEQEADAGPDEDSGANNIDPPSDMADRDGEDDGVVPSLISIPACGMTQVSYQVTVTDVLQAGPRERFTNVWIDFNRDRDWIVIIVCIDAMGTPVTVGEWAVRNQQTHLGPGEYSLNTPSFEAMGLPTPANSMWMRITLSDEPSPIEGDGRGPEAGYAYGETEDYLREGGVVPPAPLFYVKLRARAWSLLQYLRRNL